MPATLTSRPKHCQRMIITMLTCTAGILAQHDIDLTTQSAVSTFVSFTAAFLLQGLLPIEGISLAQHDHVHRFSSAPASTYGSAPLMHLLPEFLRSEGISLGCSGAS